jgi:hypothetical protein
MTGTEEQIQQYLYQGESVRDAFDVGPFRAVLTTHRLFVAMPEGGTQQADLPDVTGVDRTTRGSKSGLVWGASFVIIGLTSFALGFAASTSDALRTPEFDQDAASEVGAGSLVDLVEIIFWFIENIDTMLFWGGALFVALAALPVANYWFRVRQPTLTVRLAGEQADIHLSREHVPVEDEFRLEEALVPEQVSDDVLEDTSDEPGVDDSDSDDPAGATADEPRVDDSDGDEPTGATANGTDDESDGDDHTDGVTDGTDDDGVSFDWVDTGMTEDRANSEE